MPHWSDQSYIADHPQRGFLPNKELFMNPRLFLTISRDLLR